MLTWHLCALIALAGIAAVCIGISAAQPSVAQAQVAACYTGTVTAGTHGGTGYQGFWLNNMGSRTPTTCSINSKTVTVNQIMWRSSDTHLRVTMQGAVDADFPISVTLSRAGNTVTTGAPGAGATYGQGRGRDFPTASGDNSTLNQITQSGQTFNVTFNYVIPLAITTVAAS